MRFTKIALIFCLTLTPFSLLGAERSITMVGNGEVSVAPDMAYVTVGVHARAVSAAEALRVNSANMAEVLTVLKASEIADKDIQTSGLSLNPHWERSQSSGESPKITGFEANNSVNIRVRNLEGLGSVLDAITQAGANRINGISFGMQEPRPLLDQARQMAVADAMRKAKLYAEAAKVGLGPIISISEQQNHGRPGPMMRMEMSMAADAVPIAQGEVGLSAQVTMVFAIE